MIETASCENTNDEALAVSWYGVQTLYRHETKILQDLSAKGFSVYLPVLRETRQWSDRKKVLDMPAFPGYLFVRHDASLRSRSRILQTVGVVRLLPENHKPIAVPAIEIESIQRMLASNLPCERCAPPPLGTLVEVKRGPLAGIRGQVIRVNNKFRLAISVRTVSQAISVEVDIQNTEVVREEPAPATTPDPPESRISVVSSL